MNCVYCERPAPYQVHAGIQRLRLCERCLQAWARRELGAPLHAWLRQLKPPPQRHPVCPFCGATPETVRETGLYGCALCYALLNES